MTRPRDDHPSAFESPNVRVRARTTHRASRSSGQVPARQIRSRVAPEQGSCREASSQRARDHRIRAVDEALPTPAFTHEPGGGPERYWRSKSTSETDCPTNGYTVTRTPCFPGVSEDRASGHLGLVRRIRPERVLATQAGVRSSKVAGPPHRPLGGPVARARCGSPGARLPAGAVAVGSRVSPHWTAGASAGSVRSEVHGPLPCGCSGPGCGS